MSGNMRESQCLKKVGCGDEKQIAKDLRGGGGGGVGLTKEYFRYGRDSACLMGEGRLRGG